MWMRQTLRKALRRHSGGRRRRGRRRYWCVWIKGRIARELLGEAYGGMVGNRLGRKRERCFGSDIKCGIVRLGAGAFRGMRDSST